MSHMSLFFVAGIYFYARGVFALFGQTLFFTRRSLEMVEPTELATYLKKSGILHIVTGTVFVGKALLDVAFPYEKWVFMVFFICLFACVILLARCNERYTKK